MTLWILEARDPLIFGDGKPFSAIPGSRVRSLPTPFPSTVAGAVRTRAGTDATSGIFEKSRIPELLAESVRGPFLVELTEDGQGIKDWLLPAPADALLLRIETSKEEWARHALRPVNLPAGAQTNLAGNAIIGATKPIKEKPVAQPPGHWRWDAYRSWLQTPEDGAVTIAALGHPGPVRETRMHVSIDAETQRAEEGALFQTSGMEYRRNLSDDPRALSAVRALALAVETGAGAEPGIAFLGGERRVVRWRRAPGVLPTCPAEVRAAIMEQRACRLILITAACFGAGWRPTLPLAAALNVPVTLAGAAVPRYQTVSGWDYARRQPKPTRRLAPAGSVYFLKLPDDDAAIEQFIDAVWLQPVSDNTQDRLDGFGLAVLGAWDGDVCDVEVTG